MKTFSNSVLFDVTAIEVGDVSVVRGFDSYALSVTIRFGDGGIHRIELHSKTREQLDRLKVETVSAVLDEQFAQAAGRA